MQVGKCEVGCVEEGGASAVVEGDAAGEVVVLERADHEVVLAEEFGENETGYEGGEGAA